MLADLAAMARCQYPRSQTHRRRRQCRLSQREQALARFGAAAFSLVQHSSNRLPGVPSHSWRRAALLSSLVLELGRDLALFRRTPCEETLLLFWRCSFAFWWASYIWAMNDLRLGISYSQ